MKNTHMQKLILPGVIALCLMTTDIMAQKVKSTDVPVAVAAYVKVHYPGAKITEAGKVTDAQGKMSYEAEVKGKDLVFDEQGNFIKED